MNYMEKRSYKCDKRPNDGNTTNNKCPRNTKRRYEYPDEKSSEK